MSKNRNRAKLNLAFESSGYKKILIDILYPPYWDEMICMYPKYRRGFKNSGRQLYPSEVREFKTWKHNRKTQWKEKKYK